jgi:hypothetical protein
LQEKLHNHEGNYKQFLEQFLSTYDLVKNKEKLSQMLEQNKQADLMEEIKNLKASIVEKDNKIKD